MAKTIDRSENTGRVMVKVDWISQPAYSKKIKYINALRLKGTHKMFENFTAEQKKSSPLSYGMAKTIDRSVFHRVLTM